MQMPISLVQIILMRVLCKSIKSNICARFSYRYSVFSKLALVLLLVPAALAAQVQVVLRDKATGKAIEGVVVNAVTREGSIIQQAISDTQGKGILSIKDFPVVVTTSHVSYLPVGNEVSAPGEVVLNLESTLTELESIVVTGQYEPQSAKQSVYKVRTITMERIESSGATRLQDVLNTELNVRFAQDLSTGGSNLSLQGLSGQNVKVLIDGVPMIGRQGTGNEININQINVQSIDRVEIVEGPMSVSYGADALAGVINIITKKPEEATWTGTLRLHEETAGNEYALNRGIHNAGISLGTTRKSFYTLLDFGRNYFGGWKGGAEDRDKEWHPKTQWLASALAGWKKDNADVYYRIDYLNENIYNPGLFSGIEALDQRYITNRFMHQVQGSANLSKRIRYNGAISFTDYSRRIQTVTVNKSTGEERLALGPGLQDKTIFRGVTVRGTLHFKLNEQVSLQPGYDINYESGSGGRLKAGTSSIGDYALFVSAELKPSSWLSVRPGIRVVRNSVYQAPPLIPSLNAKVQLHEHHDLRLSYGRGFRAPSIRELYFNFFDASHSIEGNPNLKAELSHSYNASWNWKIFTSQDFTASMALAGFYNTVTDMIGYGVKPGNSSITTYLNIDRFKSKGITWTATLHKGNVDATAGTGYTARYNQLTEGTEFQDFYWSPEVNGSLAYHFVKLRARATVFYKYTGRTPFVQAKPDGTYGLNEAGDYHWADLSLQKSFGKNFSLAAGIRNLFNVTRINNTSVEAGGVHTAGNSRPIGYGRSYFASLSYKF